MDTFDIGPAPLKKGYTKTGYEDESISVTLGHETIDGTRYNYAHVKIAHASQLRTALGGDVKNARYAGFRKISSRSNAVVSINGDFYYNRAGAYIVRQSQILRNKFTAELDIMIVDYDGNLHLYHAQNAKSGIEEMQGNIYQAFAFGPALVIDGELCTDLNESYSFGATNRNPRTAIGQLNELEYLLVVADGRTKASKGVTVQTMGEYMLSKGCRQAFNLDGGASSGLYFDGKVYNLTTGDGVRSLYDVIYFATTVSEN